MHDFKETIAALGYGIEAVGVLVVIAGSLLAAVQAARSIRQVDGGVVYRDFRRRLGRSIILGLEFLIAGDIIRTVVVADTLSNVAVLALIIVIRTFLSLTLHLEVEGHWPWEAPPEQLKREQ